MTTPRRVPAVHLDHFEIHVADVAEYCDFLVRLFRGGEWKMIDPENGFAMYRTPDDRFFEIKPGTDQAAPDRSGVCLPCLRVEDAAEHLAGLGFEPDQVVKNPLGTIRFFSDAEGVEWHLKDYLRPDPTVDW